MRDKAGQAERRTTLQTPWDTGLTRDRVLKANCTQQDTVSFACHHGERKPIRRSTGQVHVG